MSSTYDPVQDKRRLKTQAASLEKVDSEILELFFSSYKPKKIIKVLDVGCANGALTLNRFSKYKNIDVLGIDKNADSIFNAEKIKKSNYSFKTFDIEKENIKNLGKFDIIFSSYLFPHISNQQSIMQKLWEILNPKGILLIRGGDDGWKITYPQRPDLEYLLKVTSTDSNSSDRKYGRKIYTQMSNLFPIPKNISLQLSCESTANLSSHERKDFFEKNYSFRANYYKNAKSNKVYNQLKKIIDKERKFFVSTNDIFSFNVNIIGIALK